MASTLISCAASFAGARKSEHHPAIIPRAATKPAEAHKRDGPVGRSFSTSQAALAARRVSKARRTWAPMLHTMPSFARLHSLFFAAAMASAVVFAGAGAASAFSNNGNGVPESPKNVFGQELEICSTDPLTGFMRNGRCETGPTDFGTHTVCAKVTDEFLQYTLQQGNDLITPRPGYRFPGLKAGDGWCLCASRWREAMLAGVAPPVVLGATHEKTLAYVDMASLQRHAAPGATSQE